MKRPLGDRLRAMWRQSSALAANAATPRDFVRLMQARLSLSKVGPLVCPTPRVVKGRLRGMGVVSLRTHSTDISVLSELLAARCYEPVLSVLAAKPNTIVDLGANTGLAARWLLSKYPGAKLIAVEPVPENVRCLRENLNGSAVVVPACIGSEARKTRMRSEAGFWAFHIVTEGEDPRAEDIEVDVVEMRSLLDQHGLARVDLLKCDIEGGEVELFSNCSGWIRRVGAAVVECHGGFTAADLLDAIRCGAGNFDLRHVDRDPAYRHEVAVVVNNDAA
jgi:FkbM family methyltransferase